MIALRGFDIAQIDQLLEQADEALATEDEASRKAARDALRDVTGSLVIAALYAAVRGTSFSGALAVIGPIALVVLIGTALLRWFGTRRH